MRAIGEGQIGQDDASSRFAPREDRVSQAVGEFLAAIEAGEADRSALLTEYEDVAEELADCLDTLDFVNNVAPQLAASTDDADHRSSKSFAPLATLGDFRIVREVGRGGMGVVYEAEQLSLGRRVALKVLPFAAVLDPRQLQRFKNEAQAAASLRHPHIVSVHAVGQERGVHFYAMELIEGQSLHEVLIKLRADLEDDARTRSAPPSRPEETAAPTGPSGAVDGDSARAADTAPIAVLSTEHSQSEPEYFRSVARLGIEAAEALEYAHQMGIVHRDIKPSNLLLDQQGKLWVTDFGLAMTQSDANLTMTGDLLGTLRYMSPEQATGNSVLDHRTDIYSLGVTLYELATLQPAFGGENRHQLMQQILNDEPARPRTLNRAVPTDLETIILKACHKDPSLRYTSAQALADDLRRFLEHRPVLARRSTAPERLWRWAQRNRALSALLIVSITLAVVGPLVAVQQARLANRATEAHQTAEQYRKELQRALDRVLMQLSEAIEGKPGMLPLQQEVLREAIDCYIRLLELAGDDPDLRFEAAVAFQTLAKARKQGTAFPLAEEAYSRAIDLLTSLVEEHPSRDDFRHQLAICRVSRGAYHRGRFSFDLSIQDYEEARPLFSALVEDDPQETRYARGLAICQHELGGILGEAGRPDESLRYARLSLATWLEIANGLTSSEKDTIELCRSYSALAHALRHTHRHEEAEDAYRQVFAMEDSLAAIAEDNAELDRFFANQHSHYAHLLLCLRRPKDAESHARKGMQRLHAHLRINPEGLHARNLLSRSWLMLAECLHDDGQHEEGEQAMRTCLAQLQELSAQMPQATEFPNYVGWAHYLLGAMLQREGRLEEATVEYQKASQLLEERYLLEPDNHMFRIRLARFLMHCPAFRDAERAIELLQQDPDPKDSRYWQALGAAQYRAHQFQAAVSSLQQSVHIRERDGDAFDWILLAMCHWQLGDQDLSRKWYSKTVEGIKNRLALDLDNFIHPGELLQLQREADELMADEQAEN